MANYKPLWKQAWRGKQCAVCATERAVHGHHIVYAQHVRREHAPMWDPRNCLPICLRCHQRHHSATARISQDRLPKQAWEFADEFGFSYYIDRYYSQEITHVCAA